MIKKLIANYKLVSVLELLGIIFFFIPVAYNNNISYNTIGICKLYFDYGYRFDAIVFFIFVFLFPISCFFILLFVNKSHFACSLTLILNAILGCIIACFFSSAKSIILNLNLYFYAVFINIFFILLMIILIVCYLNEKNIEIQKK